MSSPTDILMECADVLQTLKPPDALQKLKEDFFMNEKLPLAIRYKALRVQDFLSLTFIHYICMACTEADQ